MSPDNPDPMEYKVNSFRRDLLELIEDEFDQLCTDREVTKLCSELAEKVVERWFAAGCDPVDLEEEMDNDGYADLDFGDTDD